MTTLFSYLRNGLMISSAIALGVFSTSATASQCVVDEFENLQKVGETRLSVWFWDVYDAELRTDTGALDSAEQRALQLSYLRDIKAKDLVDTTADEWERLGITISDEHQLWLSELREMWPNVKEGDCITLLETEQGHAKFFGPSGELGEISSAQFTDDFLAIWLDENSRFKDARNELIGVQ